MEFILLLLFGFITGLRHGFDLDHIAAITDIVSSQTQRFRGFLYAMLYGVGHGAVVVLLGLLLIIVGKQIPQGTGGAFSKIVGLTLIVLGFYVFYSLYRYRASFKIKSRWMLVLDAIQFGYHKLLHNFKLSHGHPRLKEQRYGSKTAFGIGLIHGIGAETPTQVAALAALVGIEGDLHASFFLIVFTVGIFLSNLIVASLSLLGYLTLGAKRQIPIFLGIIAGVFSIVVGVFFVAS